MKPSYILFAKSQTNVKCKYTKLEENSFIGVGVLDNIFNLINALMKDGVCSISPYYKDNFRA
jgi:hypothetical protein